jgi:hypothetical protein
MKLALSFSFELSKWQSFVKIAECIPHLDTPINIMLNKPKFVLGLGNDKQSLNASFVLSEIVIDAHAGVK